MHSQLCLQRRAMKVVLWCSNTLDCLWKDMSELVLMGDGPDSIFMHLVEEYVMRSCGYTTVESLQSSSKYLYGAV